MNYKKRAINIFASFLVILANVLFLSGCDISDKQDLGRNKLKSETSKYLLQHSSNPIDWYPWGDEAFDKARSEQKLVVISIGYYACHWCQVMEKETFTDTTVARLMNESYVSIKVDREERPDIDQVYSDAAKKMTGSSGWPLNIIATPDGTPLFAGTYFENSDWQAIIQRANYLYQENPDETLKQAEKLAESLKAEVNNRNESITLEFPEIEATWINQSDSLNGGISGNQKFPNSPYLSALLDFTYYLPNREIDVFLRKTLDNMALGGMFDHLDGGFARYSTDREWKIPHFEKMLYDNAQLMAVYAKAYRKYKDPFYLHIAEQTANFLVKEFKSDNGGFYSSMNAVSDEIEGGYYTWKLSDLPKSDNLGLITEAFNITQDGNWEAGQNVLYALDIEKKEYLEIVKSPMIAKMSKERSRRSAPPKDNKIITNWNALALDGFVELYKATKNKDYLIEAQNLGNYLISSHLNNSTVSHTNDQTDVGFLDDYTQLAAALIQLYQVTFNETWIETAKNISTEMLEVFKSDDSPLLRQSTASDQLFMSSYPTLDTDLPSGNSQASFNLVLLSDFYYDTNNNWKEIAEQMLSAQEEEIRMLPTFTGTWVRTLLQLRNSPYEVAILGEKANEVRTEMDMDFRPDILFLGGNKEGNIPLLEYKLREGSTMIYVCQNKTCRFPTENPKTAYSMTLPQFNAQIQ